MKNFRSVNLPRVLINDVEKFIKNPEITHNTIASYVEFSIRTQMEKDKQHVIDERKFQRLLKLTKKDD